MDRIFADNNNNYGVCQDHQQSLVYICTDHKQDTIMKCLQCITDYQIPTKYLITIAEIVKSDKQTIFQNWPLQNDNNQILEIKKISNKPPTDQVLNERIISYFEELEMQMIATINKLKKDMLMKTNELFWNLNDKIITEYNQLSCKEDIKNSIQNQSLSFKQKNTQLKEIITQAVLNQQQNKERFVKSVENLKAQERVIDYETPKQIMKEVLEKMGKINFFLHDNINQLFWVNPNYNQINDNIQGTDNISVIMSLIGNKLNRCGPEFLTKVENHLRNYSVIMQKLDFGQIRLINEVPPNLDSLNKDDLNLIMDFTRCLIQNKKDNSATNQVEVIMKLVRNKFNNCCKEYLEQLETHLQKYKIIFNQMQVGQVQNNKFQILNLDKLDDDEVNNMTNIASQILQGKQWFLQSKYNQIQINTQTIMKLVRNRTNFCDDQFLNQLENILTGVEKYLNSYKVDRIHKRGRQPIKFYKLSDEQLNNINKLTEKMNELTINHGNNYVQSIKPQQEIQQQSYIISQCIESNLQRSQTQHNIIKQLLINYPIFETIDLTPSWTKIQMNFIKSNYKESQKLQLNGNGNVYDIIHLQNNSCYQIAMSDQSLVANVVYVIRCRFSRPIKTGSIFIGLMYTNQITQQPPIVNLESGFFSCRENYAEIIKGNNLSCEKIKNTITALEFRVCLSTRQLYFADYPNYTNVNKAHEFGIDPILAQKFVVVVNNLGDNFGIRLDNFQVMQDKSLIGIFE